MSDLILRLGKELLAAAERQAEATARRRRRPAAWVRRGSGRTLLAAGAAVALAGAGGAASLLSERGEVGGPPTLTYARPMPTQAAAGLRQLSEPVVIGRGRLPHSGHAWQLVAFQTTNGLCIAFDVPAVANMGGGCATDVPRDGRAIDWQGYLSRPGRSTPATIIGAVAPRAARVTLAHGFGRRRLAEPARIVQVSDPRVLDAIGVRRPFALWLGEVTEANPTARAVAYDRAGEKLGAVGIPNGGAGDAGFLPRGYEPPSGDDFAVADEAIPLAQVLRERFAALRRPQRGSDRPGWLVRRLIGPTAGSAVPWFGSSVRAVDLSAIRRAGSAPDGRPLFLIVTKRRVSRLPADCMRTTTPRLQREQQRHERLRRRAERTVHLALVDGRLRSYGAATEESVDRRALGARDAGRARRGALLTALVPDGIATVELILPDGTRRTVTVDDNLLAVEVPLRPVDALDARQLWRDAEGRLVPRGR